MGIGHKPCKLLMFQLWKAQVVSHVGNIWIGPWANVPQYMDRTLCDVTQQSLVLRYDLTDTAGVLEN